VRGLLGSNHGPATDFSPDGWRVSPGTSLLDESAGSATPAFLQAVAQELAPAGIVSQDRGAMPQDLPSQFSASLLASSSVHSPVHT
jgi:hypothetical protein